MINYTIDKGVTNKGSTLYAGTTEETHRNSATVSFTKWFKSLKDLEEAHPEFKGAEVKDLGLLNF